MATSFITALFTNVITIEMINKARGDVNITENSRDVASGKAIPVFNVVTFPNRFCIFHLFNVSVGTNIQDGFFNCPPLILLSGGW